MLISTDIHPEKNIIYVGAMILKLINKEKKQELDILKLYKEYNKKYMNISLNLFIQSITWLYMCKIIKKVNDKGDICI